VRTILFLGFLTIAKVVWSAEPVSYQGMVVLQTGQVLTGQIYMPSFELVFLVSGEKRMALPVHKIKQVRFYDSSIDVNRKFELLHYYSETGFSGLVLFETVLVGNIKVLRKPRMGRLNASGGDHDEFNYYYVSDNGIESMSKFHRKLLPGMQDELGDALKEFLRVHDLSATNSMDAIQIIKFYNNTRNSPQVMAGLR